MDAPLLQIRNLKIHFFVRQGIVKAVDGINFDVAHRETVGIVGESGSGKSASALAIMRLISQPGRIVDGRILLRGRDIRTLPANRMPEIRGNEVSMIFQEPMTSLNPVFTVGRQITEALLAHQSFSRRDARLQAGHMLEKVGLVPGTKHLNDYPHQLSGGQRQRVMIAIALACRPNLLIADEPTTALDVTIQAQILDLIGNLKEDQNTAVILISHDLGVIADMAQRVIVMYAGKIMEEAGVRAIFKSARHPYTQSLLKSIPYLSATGPRERLYEIPGTIPSLLDPPAGCAFHPRCDFREPRCWEQAPPMVAIAEGHHVRCWRT